MPFFIYCKYNSFALYLCYTMQIHVYKDYETLSLYTAEHIIQAIKTNPRAVLCFASGESPKRTCELFCDRIIREEIDISGLSFVGLDEWVGIAPENSGSCHYFFQTMILDRIPLTSDQIHLFDGLSADLQRECKKMDDFIAARGGIDLMMVGVGMNGHIGFNEPGISFNKYSHVIDLDETTATVGQKYFKEQTTLQKGITLGLQHFLESRKAIVIANGTRKASVMENALKGRVSEQMPASIVQQHPAVHILLDEGAGGLING